MTSPPRRFAVRKAGENAFYAFVERIHAIPWVQRQRNGTGPIGRAAQMRTQAEFGGGGVAASRGAMQIRWLLATAFALGVLFLLIFVYMSTQSPDGDPANPAVVEATETEDDDTSDTASSQESGSSSEGAGTTAGASSGGSALDGVASAADADCAALCATAAGLDCTAMFAEDLDVLADLPGEQTCALVDDGTGNFVPAVVTVLLMEGESLEDAADGTALGDMIADASDTTEATTEATTDHGDATDTTDTSSDGATESPTSGDTTTALPAMPQHDDCVTAVASVDDGSIDDAYAACLDAVSADDNDDRCSDLAGPIGSAEWIACIEAALVADAADAATGSSDDCYPVPPGGCGDTDDCYPIPAGGCGGTDDCYPIPAGGFVAGHPCGEDPDCENTDPDASDTDLCQGEGDCYPVPPGGCVDEPTEPPVTEQPDTPADAGDCEVTVISIAYWMHIQDGHIQSHIAAIDAMLRDNVTAGPASDTPCCEPGVYVDPVDGDITILVPSHELTPDMVDEIHRLDADGPVVQTLDSPVQYMAGMSHLSD